MEVYLDNSATTRPCQQCIEAMSSCMREQYFNPSALYAPSVAMEKELLAARRTIADRLQMGEHGVIFTSGGTESNNMAILGHMLGQRKDGTILYSAAEHPSVKNACTETALLLQHTAQEIPLTTRGSVDLEALEKMLNPSVRLICVMQVCNETGVVMPLPEIVQLRDRLAPAAAIHVDGVQGFLRVPLSMATLKIQSYSLSAHKIHGPKGVGALVIREGHRMRPILYGGGQQNGMRSGTENTSGILGLRAAVEAYPHYAFACSQMLLLKRTLANLLLDKLPGSAVLGARPEEKDSASHILTMAFPPVRSETLVHALEADGVWIGTGSACSAHKQKRSAVLTAMRVDPALIDCSVRISLSPRNTPEEIAYAAEKIIQNVQLLGRYKRR